MNKKASTQIGIGIIAMALLLLLGSIFFDQNPNDKNSYIDSKNYYTNNSNYNYNYLFYLNNTNLGTQQKVTENYPNIILGEKTQYNDIYLSNIFKLYSNPFSNNKYPIKFQPSEIENIDEFLVYFTPKKDSGEEIIKIYFNNKLILENKIKNLNLPIKIPNQNINKLSSETQKILSEVIKEPFITVDELSKKFNYSKKRIIANLIKLENSSIIKRKKYEDTYYFEIKENQPSQTIELELQKPKIYQLFTWNSIEIEDLKIVEVIKNTKNKNRKFNFQIKKDFLEAVYINLAISCEEIKDISEPIEIKVNDFIISNENPSCKSNYNKITAKVPLNILSNIQNTLELSTNGYYKIAYSITKVYFNDQQTYKFTINSFNDIRDVVIYGDFNKEVIDLRLNSQTFSLNKDEIKSIIGYLRFGINELKILTKPVEIKELIIEKNDFYD